VRAQSSVDYVEQIKPLFARKCLPCHGALKQESDLRLDTAAAMIDAGIVVPENLGQSELIGRIKTDDLSTRMPPEGEPLSDAESLLIENWINQGAKHPRGEQAQADPKKHWSFQPIEKPLIPASFHRHPIDYFIERGLMTAGLTMSDSASSVDLCRRLHLDLHGLPPTRDEIESFSSGMQQNAASTIRNKIQTLLGSPRYGERWGQHWLDIVRYADTHGFEVNTPRENAWPYRDYVIRSLNENKPYDQFIREQIAGDQFAQDAATGFLVAAPVLLPGQIGKDDASKRLARQDSLDEIVVGTSASFLGLTIGCARCHDHKFDPISQQDYYAFQAFFSGVQYGDRPYRDGKENEREKEARVVAGEIEQIKTTLSTYYPLAETARTIIIDDEDTNHTTHLSDKNGHGTNPEGRDRGYRDDPGGNTRLGNLSRGRYTWWDNQPGADVFTWDPKSPGSFHLWISWGVHGSGVHTRDARYVLDLDGDLNTESDQQEIATADQYYFAGQNDGESEKKPLWSGFHYAGQHTLTSTSRLVLRGGDTGTGITADVIVLQGTTTPSQSLPSLRDPVSAKRNIERFEPVLTKFVRFTSLKTIDENRHQPCLDEIEIYAVDQPANNLALETLGTIATSSGNYSETGKHQLKHINDGVYGNENSWISNEFGKGWVQLELPNPSTIDRLVWGRDRNTKFSDRLPVDYIVEVSLDGEKWMVVAGSMDRVPVGTPTDEVITLTRQHELQEEEGNGQSKISNQLEQLRSLEKRVALLQQPKLVYAGNFTTPEQTHFLNRGDPEQPQHPVPPTTPSVLSGVSIPETAGDKERRFELANWIANPSNPLTARVMVNRIWQFHFGVGLVDSPSDFGINGSQPSHPELLDWLASEFIVNEWSINHLHELIMTSQTYQQSSLVRAEAASIDADCRLLWRYPSRRLEAESIRDSILKVAGNINWKMGGSGFNFFQTRGGLSGFPHLKDFTNEELRRTIYSHKIRMEPIPVFGAFDCPDAGQPTAKRTQSTTAIQALNLFNSAFMVEQSRVFAQRLIAEVGSGHQERIERAFELSFGRLPTESELMKCKKFVNTHGIEPLCRVLFNSNEFLFIP